MELLYQENNYRFYVDCGIYKLYHLSHSGLIKIKEFDNKKGMWQFYREKCRL